MNTGRYFTDGAYGIIGSLSTRVFETRTETGSELFSLLTCFHATTFTLLSIFSPSEMISTQIWETPLFWHARFSLPVAVRFSKTRVLKFPIDLGELVTLINHLGLQRTNSLLSVNLTSNPYVTFHEIHSPTIVQQSRSSSITDMVKSHYS